jgi:hypothetical protein
MRDYRMLLEDSENLRGMVGTEVEERDIHVLSTDHCESHGSSRNQTSCCILMTVSALYNLTDLYMMGDIFVHGIHMKLYRVYEMSDLDPRKARKK